MAGAKQAGTKQIKIQVKAGSATPAPPIGTVLGPTGINMGDFCSKFNAETQDRAGEIVPVVLTINADKSFSFILKTAPVSFMLKKAAGIEKGSGKNLTEKAGKVSEADVKKIAEKKMVDLNARDVNAAIAIVKGTAQSMGLEVA